MEESLPDHLEEKRTRVRCGADAPTWTSSLKTASSFAHLGVDNKLDLESFSQRLKIKVQEYKPTEGLLVFDLIGVDASIANAFRRILISELPTMAIEHVYIKNNTSIIQDEVLAHRLGLIPIRADPRLFTTKHPDEDPTDENTIVFKLHVKCSRATDTESDNPDERYINSKVYSKDLEWVPQGEQSVTFANAPIAPVHDDILIAKLRPGQEIELETHCTKGEGQEHAKWSPVATASYRLMPEIVLREEITGAAAEELVAKCPMKVFDIEDLPVKQAIVKRPRNCTMCRECIREPEWDRRIKLLRVKDHFIFSIESTGILPPDALFVEAVKVFMVKCQTIIGELDSSNQPA